MDADAMIGLDVLSVGFFRQGSLEGAKVAVMSGRGRNVHKGNDEAVLPCKGTALTRSVTAASDEAFLDGWGFALCAGEALAINHWMNGKPPNAVGVVVRRCFNVLCSVFGS